MSQATAKQQVSDYWVRLNDSVEREWQAVLGRPDIRLPVMSAIPWLASLPGYDIPQRVFLLDVASMEQNDVERIAAKLAGKFGLTMTEAEEEIRKAGIPIREEHVSVVIVHRPQRWL